MRVDGSIPSPRPEGPDSTGAAAVAGTREIFRGGKASADQIEQHKNRLALRLGDAERSGTWDSTKTDFIADWNSLIVEFELLEERLYK
jgi:hypothetical protein